MTVTQGKRPADGSEEAGRGERTRALILEASRKLFLQRGFAGTPVNAITEACGISRAGFYTYFKDKEEIFAVLGESAYRDVMAVLKRLDSVPRPFTAEALRSWVGEYFAFLDRHGAFVLGAWHSSPEEEAFRRSRNRTVSRSAFRLGQAIAGPGDHSPEVVGIAVLGMLDRAWHAEKIQVVAVERDEVISALADMILRLANE
ncbi:TetR family transcriptional regulator [Mycobacterium sp. E342]|uniref:TetR/AcrR family transcriptional regulator n=1 Tax=Mycobacterium sp. E342 TaxID=1834147 RepID=UPI0007FFFE21|nr:TetR/AcrR family transcriptional regulator [Mycobacterium sp. E342]OBH32094.1 TetR family transcriptional regulator [Mycobacterium sp. E342]